MDSCLISLCMIVKNEEECLPRCLDSVKDVVDEIIIVDTGSTDSTKEIARHYGAKLFDFEWINDFSSARNFSLDQASGEWILVLDADEELEPTTAKKLRQIARETDADAFIIQIRNFYRHSTQKTVDVGAVRFFRNRPFYRYTRRYHEVVDPSILSHNGKIASDRSLVIFHDGYLRETAQGKSRKERAIQHMKIELEENPEQLWLLAKIGMELRDVGEEEEAYRYLLQFANLVISKKPDELDVNLFDLHNALIHLADLALQRKEFNLAKACGIAGRRLTNEFSVRLAGELAIIGGTLGEIHSLLIEVNEKFSIDQPLAPADLSLLRQKLQELIELENEIEALRNGFYTLLTSSQRNLLRSWKHDCRQLIQILQHLTQTAEPHT